MIINKFNDEANDSVKKTTNELGTADEIKDEEFYDFEEADEPVFVPMALDYLIDYNDAFRNEQPTRFRDEVINQTLSCLIGMFKPNALLVGAAGVGKTKIVEDIARRLASKDPALPEQLDGYTVYELPLSNIVLSQENNLFPLP